MTSIGILPHEPDLDAVAMQKRRVAQAYRAELQRQMAEKKAKQADLKSQQLGGDSSSVSGPSSGLPHQRSDDRMAAFRSRYDSLQDQKAELLAQLDRGRHASGGPASPRGSGPPSAAAGARGLARQYASEIGSLLPSPPPPPPAFPQRRDDSPPRRMGPGSASVGNLHFERDRDRVGDRDRYSRDHERDAYDEPLDPRHRRDRFDDRDRERAPPARERGGRPDSPPSRRAAVDPAPGVGRRNGIPNYWQLDRQPSGAAAAAASSEPPSDDRRRYDGGLERTLVRPSPADDRDRRDERARDRARDRSPDRAAYDRPHRDDRSPYRRFEEQQQPAEFERRAPPPSRDRRDEYAPRGYHRDDRDDRHRPPPMRDEPHLSEPSHVRCASAPYSSDAHDYGTPRRAAPHHSSNAAPPMHSDRDRAYPSDPPSASSAPVPAPTSFPRPSHKAWTSPNGVFGTGDAEEKRVAQEERRKREYALELQRQIDEKTAKKAREKREEEEREEREQAKLKEMLEKEKGGGGSHNDRPPNHRRTPSHDEPPPRSRAHSPSGPPPTRSNKGTLLDFPVHHAVDSAANSRDVSPARGREHSHRARDYPRDHEDDRDSGYRGGRSDVRDRDRDREDERYAPHRERPSARDRPTDNRFDDRQPRDRDERRDEVDDDRRRRHDPRMEDESERGRDRDRRSPHGAVDVARDRAGDGATSRGTPPHSDPLKHGLDSQSREGAARRAQREQDQRDADAAEDRRIERERQELQERYERERARERPLQDTPPSAGAPPPAPKSNRTPDSGRGGWGHGARERDLGRDFDDEARPSGAVAPAVPLAAMRQSGRARDREYDPLNYSYSEDRPDYAERRTGGGGGGGLSSRTPNSRRGDAFSDSTVGLLQIEADAQQRIAKLEALERARRAAAPALQRPPPPPREEHDPRVDPRVGGPSSQRMLADLPQAAYRPSYPSSPQRSTAASFARSPPHSPGASGSFAIGGGRVPSLPATGLGRGASGGSSFNPRMLEQSLHSSSDFRHVDASVALGRTQHLAHALSGLRVSEEDSVDADMRLDAPVAGILQEKSLFIAPDGSTSAVPMPFEERDGMDVNASSRMARVNVNQYTDATAAPTVRTPTHHMLRSSHLFSSTFAIPSYGAATHSSSVASSASPTAAARLQMSSSRAALPPPPTLSPTSAHIAAAASSIAASTSRSSTPQRAAVPQVVGSPASSRSSVYSDNFLDGSVVLDEEEAPRHEHDDDTSAHDLNSSRTRVQPQTTQSPLAAFASPRTSANPTTPTLRSPTLL